MRFTPTSFVPLVVGLAALGTSGCRACAPDTSPSAADASAPTVAACARRTTERIGIPFVKVCPQDLGFPGAAFEPFWIAAAPLGCSAGEHETLQCPSVIALAHPAAGDSRAPSPLHGRLAAVVEADVAQSVCYMRFAGRLPTRAERSRAETAMGLASVVVAQRGTPPHFEFFGLSEWVTDSACETPTVDRCTPAYHPAGPREPIPWGAIASCDASPLSPETRAGAVLLGLGESCPAPDFAWGPGATLLPCALRSPAPRPSTVGFTLSCKAPERAPHANAPVTTTAAFRCVVPEVALLTGPAPSGP